LLAKPAMDIKLLLIAAWVLKFNWKKSIQNKRCQSYQAHTCWCITGFQISYFLCTVFVLCNVGFLENLSDNWKICPRSVLNKLNKHSSDEQIYKGTTQFKMQHKQELLSSFELQRNKTKWLRIKLIILLT